MQFSSMVSSSTLLLVSCGALFVQSATAEVVIPYNGYSASATVERGHGTSTDPNNPGYGAMRIFIQKVIDYTAALPGDQKVIFQRDQKTPPHINSVRAGISYANKNAQAGPQFSNPDWGFIYNSVPFGMNFERMLGFLYDAKFDEGRNGIELAQAILDSRGGTQIVFPVVGGTMQGSGYFPQPLGKPNCLAGDVDCEKHGNGIGLAGLCTSSWRIRYLKPPQDIIDRACDALVKRGVIAAKTLTFYPPVGGQPVLLPMQRRVIQGFEYVNPYDDFAEFFPIKNATPDRPLGDPNSGKLDCSPELSFPIPAGTEANCTQNIGQIGARFAHYPAWHQPFLLSWMHVDKAIWDGLSEGQKSAILRASKEAVVESYNATESVECKKLRDMLDINDGIVQRNVDGTPRLVDGKPVSARMTIAKWPDDALKILREARDDYMTSLEGPNNPSEKTDAQKDFSIIAKAWRQYSVSVGSDEKFDPGVFPAKTGLTKSETCNLIQQAVR